MNEHHRGAKALLDVISVLLMEAREQIALNAQRAKMLEESDMGNEIRWRDISTAPKDGTEILVCKATDADGDPVGDAFGLLTQRVTWWSKETGGPGEWVVYCSIPEEPRLFFEPTHWMPIPPPPEV